MLAKSQRLNLKKSFNFVSSGKKVETPSMRLMMKLGENDHALVGIALTKKYFSKSFARNRAKRLAATAVQSVYPRLISQLNLVIMPKSEILKKSVEQLVGELENVKALYRTN